MTPAIRVGSGTLIEDDVQLGGQPGSRRSGGGLEIGIRGIIRRGSTVLDGVRIGERLETGINVVIREDTRIGDDCRVGNNTIIDAECTIGDRVQIDANCHIARYTTIEDDVAIAPGVCLVDEPHPGSESHLCRRGPTIGRGAQIGTNATILPFVTVGERSLVGAGSVVTHDVPAAMVVVGNPARVLKPVAAVTCPLDIIGGGYLENLRSGDPPVREESAEPQDAPQNDHRPRVRQPKLHARENDLAHDQANGKDREDPQPRVAKSHVLR